MNETIYNRRQNKVFALFGAIGGLICSVADVPGWHFPASIWIVSVAVPMYVIGTIVGITIVCIVLAIGWLGVGEASRMIAMWCFAAWLAEKKQKAV